MSSRRNPKQKAEPTQKLIVFWLQQEWFAVPIQFAHRVVPMEQVYGTCDGGGMGLMLYQGQELYVLDIKQLVFRQQNMPQPAQAPSLPSSNRGVQAQATGATGDRSTAAIDPPRGYMLILQNSQGELVGIPIDNQPKLRRVRESAFMPVPSAYLIEGNIRCISALVVPSPEEPPLFLLNLTQLVQPQSALPATPLP